MKSIAGIAIRGNLVFVAKRQAGGAMGGKWEFPGGKSEPGESVDQTAQREFEEEFGLTVRVGRTIGESTFNNGRKQYELVAVLVAFEGEPRELKEHDSCMWVDAPALQLLDLADSDRSLLPCVLPLLVVT